MLGPISDIYYTGHGWVGTRPLKDQVFIFGAALGFPIIWSILILIGTILSKIDQYLDLPHQV